MDEEELDGIQMRITKQSGFGNTSLFGTITIRHTLTVGLAILFGFLLIRTPLINMGFASFFAMLAYVAIVSVVMGMTPTGRNILTNIYGVLLGKKVNMLVTEDMTTNTVGHGISEVIIDEPEIGDMKAFRMSSTKNIALVYSITSGINRWSTEDEKAKEIIRIKNLFNILEGGESVSIVHKQNNDTGMLQLRDSLLERENFEGDDLVKMSQKRSRLLHAAGTRAEGRSIQQYAVLMIKPRNIVNATKHMHNASRLISPASNPAGILFSMMGYEGGVEWTEDYAKENVRPWENDEEDDEEDNEENDETEDDNLPEEEADEEADEENPSDETEAETSEMPDEKKGVGA